ncbi:MAG TPA: GGDEF domain-containing protein [Holophaga sp.]|nr:GGDEF domain-containing protein [Holophaga sp.]
MAKPDKEWTAEVDPPDPTVPASGWPDFETALRKRFPGETGPVPCEHVVVVYAGAHLGRVFPLVAGINVIGRSPQVDIALLDEEVSRVHASITLTQGPGGERLELEDKGSTNGTFVNGRPVAGALALRPGDRIALGNHVLKLVAMDAMERAFHAVLLDQSSRDTLTGLANRRSTLEEMQRRFDLSRRHHRPLSLIMCDLDHFKRINDTLGHLGGDQVLRDFGARASAGLRTTDVAGRIGGEEFLIVLPETDRDGALLLAERLRAAVRDEPFHLPSGPLSVTCSLGVAERRDEDRDGGALMGRADRALYLAKRDGRDRVVCD